MTDSDPIAIVSEHLRAILEAIARGHISAPEGIANHKRFGQRVLADDATPAENAP